MDCQMPMMDGFDATAQIRTSEGAGKRIPIIALTAHTLPENREKCLAAGMDDFLSKPVVPATLHNMLAQWLKRDGVNARATDAVSPEPELNNYVAIRNMIGRAAFDEAASVFINDFAPQKLAALREASSRGSVSDVSTISHVITGSASILGANRLSKLCRDLEHQARQGKHLDGVAEKIVEIEAEYALVEQQIRTLFANDQTR
jgi:response regulator RpfG family c-di-GMP phosphodiesterase